MTTSSISQTAVESFVVYIQYGNRPQYRVVLESQDEAGVRSLVSILYPGARVISCELA